MTDFVPSLLSGLSDILLQAITLLARLVVSILSFLLSPLLSLLSALDFVTPFIDDIIATIESSHGNSAFDWAITVANDLFALNDVLQIISAFGLFVLAYQGYRLASVVVRALFNKFGITLWE